MNEQRPLTAYENWLQQRQGQQAPRTPSGNDYLSTPRNFLPPSQRTSFTIPAGQSAYAAVDPFPDRTSLDQRRVTQADIAREAEAATRLSGSSTVSNPRQEAQRGWHKVVGFQRATGQIYSQWVRDEDE